MNFYEILLTEFPKRTSSERKFLTKPPKGKCWCNSRRAFQYLLKEISGKFPDSILHGIPRRNSRSCLHKVFLMGSPKGTLIFFNEISRMNSWRNPLFDLLAASTIPSSISREYSLRSIHKKLQAKSPEEIPSGIYRRIRAKSPDEITGRINKENSWRNLQSFFLVRPQL